ncbi:MAG: cytochrome b N-terminal domain-containing protein [Candidatus Omnitrophica bacterium]|nr:cytochrome b N-terminal domain-containing protein [Candidatus Omnitrophota bacterium]
MPETIEQKPPKKKLVNWEELSRQIKASQFYKSMFRRDYKDTPRNRALAVIGNVWLHLHPVKVRKHGIRYSFTWGMGGISFYLFLVLLVSGVLLMFYYRPSIPEAYHDMKFLEFDVPFGMFLRNIHRWSGHAMVVTVWLHMLRVFMTGSYKPPREFNWGVGVVLLTFTLLLSFTGYLLPWDQLALWAVTVGTNMAKATPFLGAEGPFSIVDAASDVRFALLGGRIVGPNALLRFYVFHCIAFPLIFLVFLSVHLWRVRKDGGISGP